MHLLLDNRISTQSTKVNSPVSVHAVLYSVIVRNIPFFKLSNQINSEDKKKNLCQYRHFVLMYFIKCV